MRQKFERKLSLIKTSLLFRFFIAIKNHHNKFTHNSFNCKRKASYNGRTNLIIYSLDLGEEACDWGYMRSLESPADARSRVLLLEKRSCGFSLRAFECNVDFMTLVTNATRMQAGVSKG